MLDRIKLINIAAFACVATGHALQAQLARPAFVDGRLASLTPTEESALALSAAPKPVSDGAGVYVLADTGFVLQRHSTNGFYCLVERFAGRSIFPTCYDSYASSTFLQGVIMRESLQRRGITQSVADSLVEIGQESREMCRALWALLLPDDGRSPRTPLVAGGPDCRWQTRRDFLSQRFQWGGDYVGATATEGGAAAVWPRTDAMGTRRLEVVMVHISSTSGASWLR